MLLRHIFVVWFCKSRQKWLKAPTDSHEQPHTESAGHSDVVCHSLNPRKDQNGANNHTEMDQRCIKCNKL